MGGGGVALVQTDGGDTIRHSDSRDEPGGPCYSETIPCRAGGQAVSSVQCLSSQH